MATFALVHGSWHDAGCWKLLIPMLREQGHNAIAMDLPCEDTTASFSDYADVVCDALRDCGDDVILVGHSLGGHTIPLVAARRRLRHMVYLCALVPDIGRSLLDQMRAEAGMLVPGWNAALSAPDEHRRTAWIDPAATCEVFYADCDAATAAAAFGALRPQAIYPQTLVFPLDKFPSVRTTYVICTEDRLVGGDWARRVARDRLDAEIVQLPGDHSPFLSRPAALADVLLALV